MAKYVVRYGVMRLLGVFSPTAGAEFRRGTEVIARTDRGLEAAEVLCEALDPAMAGLKDAAEGQILRAMTHEDSLELDRIREQTRHELQLCQQHVDRLKLSMQLVDVEHIFGGERIVSITWRRAASISASWSAAGRRVPDADRNAADRRPRRGQAPGRLRRLRHPGLLQHPPGGDAAGVDEDGQVAEGDARSDEDFRALRAVEVLPAL